MNPERSGAGLHTGRVAVAVYDGNCKLCRGFASILRKLVSPARLDVVACDTPLQYKLAPEVGAASCREAFLLVEAGGRVLAGGDAAAAAVAMAPGLAPYRWMIEQGPGNWLARATYGLMGLLRLKRGCRGCGKKR